MHVKRTVACLALCAFLSGCVKQTLDTSYYLLEFSTSGANPQLTRKEPIPYRVQVLTFKIPRSYDSVRIIARFSAHQINYYRYSLWAVRPQVAVADMLTQQINSYRLFKDCQREFLDERPDYEITGEVTQVERFESTLYSAAHLKMEFSLYDYDDRDILVKHSFDREVPIPTGNMSIFVKAISDILKAESDAFLVKVMEYFDTQKTDTLKTEPETIVTPTE